MLRLYKMEDLLKAEINNLEQLYNAKSVDIDCFENSYYLKNMQFLSLY